MEVVQDMSNMMAEYQAQSQEQVCSNHDDIHNDFYR